MLSQRHRFLIQTVAAILGIWIAAWGGHLYFAHLKMTAEKVRAYMESVDFGNLDPAGRARALKELEDKLNALSYEERQRLQLQHFMNDWFAQMTEDEKAAFLDATLPANFKQTIEAFEQLPADKRKRVVDDAIRNLRNVGNTNRRAASNTNRPPPVSPKLEAEIRTIGLKSFYSQSSAQTKAEVAPLLEEMQRQMESARVLGHP